MVNYQEHGYKDRNDYLKQLSKEYGIDLSVIQALADVLGPNEDFDGLVDELKNITESKDNPWYDEYLEDDFFDRCLG